MCLTVHRYYAPRRYRQGTYRDTVEFFLGGIFLKESEEIWPQKSQNNKDAEEILDPLKSPKKT